MNRFDRVTSILRLLQTRSVITARFLSDHFDVTERTIYRDIRTLENAGVRIGAEEGIGYFLEKGYRLPPVSFTLDEAASLLLGEKLLVSGLDPDSLCDFKQALNKVRAVIYSADTDYLSSLDADLEVFPTGSHFPIDDTNRHSFRRTGTISPNPPDTGLSVLSVTVGSTLSNGKVVPCAVPLIELIGETPCNEHQSIRGPGL